MQQTRMCPAHLPVASLLGSNHDDLPTGAVCCAGRHLQDLLNRRPWNMLHAFAGGKHPHFYHANTAGTAAASPYYCHQSLLRGS
jgi:hypothetical protein